MNQPILPNFDVSEYNAPFTSPSSDTMSNAILAPSYTLLSLINKRTNLHCMIKRAKACVFKPKIYNITTSPISHEPSSIKEALLKKFYPHQPGFKPRTMNMLLSLKIKLGPLPLFLLVLRSWDVNGYLIIS